MASISTDKSGNRKLQFVKPGGGRSTIYLGKITLRIADRLKNRVEALVTANIAKVSIDQETADWLAKIDDVLYAKLVAVGLAPERVRAGRIGLCEFIDSYLEVRTDIKPITRKRLEHARRLLVEFFGEQRPIDEITQAGADDFRLHLTGKLAMNQNSTAARMCGRAKQFFRYAVRKQLLADNPFGDMKGLAVKANDAREFFITPEMASKVLAACPDVEWRVLFGLSRYGGLRCPSEHLAMLWDDIDWERNRIKVRSSKTEHHDGKATREIPLFPELRPDLEAAYGRRAKGAKHVITRYRDSNSNLRTQLHKIIRKAGMEPWPKIFQNLRSTRETELAEEYPIHVVCKWIGNSEAVAKKHYLQTTDAHFERATGKATQNPTQQASESTRTGPSEPERKSCNPRKNKDFPTNPATSANPRGGTLE